MIDNKDKVHGKSFVIFGGDVQIINSVERMLLFAGATVQAATTAREGLSKVLNTRPDAVIIDDTVTDIEMSEVVATLQANELTKLLPIIMITSVRASDDYKKLFLVGEQHYLVRTEFDVMTLVLLVESILRNKNKEGPSEIFDFSESVTTEHHPDVVEAVRLLVVEDDPLLRNLLSIRLEKSGITHQFCHAGDKALEQILEFKPTIVILDLMLPGKNGMDVLADVRNHDGIKDLPVIIFSNKDDDVERMRAKALGVDNFLVKATTDLGTLITLILNYGK
jgi:two-component system OmpR family response regulator